MRIRTFARSLAALAVGLSVLTAHAASNDNPSKQLIRMTTADIYGNKIPLAKYLVDGQVCQQYVKQTRYTQEYTRTAKNKRTPGRYSWDVELDEICDRPELRMVDGELELFPAMLVEMKALRVGESQVDFPVGGVSSVHGSEPDHPVAERLELEPGVR